MPDLDLDNLADELADFALAKNKQATYTPREERIIAGFEDIERFYDEHGRSPQHGEERDIFERLYAVRLDRLSELEECRTLLVQFDKKMNCLWLNPGACGYKGFHKVKTLLRFAKHQQATFQRRFHPCTCARRRRTPTSAPRSISSATS